MKTLILLIALVVILAGLPVVVVSNTPPADSDIPDNEIATCRTKASNSSTTATITITMYAVAGSCVIDQSDGPVVVGADFKR